MASVNATLRLTELQEVRETLERLERENSELREAMTARRIIALTPPPSGASFLCMICATDRPWGVWSPTGAAVCIECRDKAREPDWKARYEEQVALTYQCKDIIQHYVVAIVDQGGCTHHENNDRMTPPEAIANLVNRIRNEVRAELADKQSMDDLAASGGIVDAP